MKSEVENLYRARRIEVKRILIISLIISCYIMIIYINIDGIFFNDSSSYFNICVYPVLTIALAIANIIYAIVTALNYKKIIMKNYSHGKIVLVFKLIMIPFFILNFAMWYMFVGLFLLFGGLVFIPIGIAFTYIILLSSSAYVMAELFVYYKSGKVNFRFLILHSLLQLLFVIDIIDYIYIHRTLNKIYKIEQNLVQSIP